MADSRHLVVSNIQVVQNQNFVEMSLSLGQQIIGSFLIRINNCTCQYNLCYKDNYDYEDPNNDPIFVVESGVSSATNIAWEINFYSKEVVWAGHDWYFYGSSPVIWKKLRIKDKRRLIRKCKEVLRQKPKWRWVIGVDHE